MTCPLCHTDEYPVRECAGCGVRACEECAFDAGWSYSDLSDWSCDGCIRASCPPYSSDYGLPRRECCSCGSTQHADERCLRTGR